MRDVNLVLSLHPAQLQVFQAPTRFTVLDAGRRFGKTDLAIKRTSTKALDPRNVKKKPCWIIAPTHPQAKQLYWQGLLDLLHPVIKKVNSNEGLMYLSNGVQVGVKGADRPDSLRGVGLYDAVLDEFADMKAQTWEVIIRPALSDVLGTALFIGTPKGRNHFYHLVQYAKSGVDPDWSHFHFTSEDNPYLPAGEIEQARKTMSSSMFRQEFLASFEGGGSDVFNADWLKYDETEPKDGDWYVAVDLAGFEDIAKATNVREQRLDKTGIAVVKITDNGHWWVKRVLLGRWGVEETARRIVDAVEEVKSLNVGIEKGALYNAVAPYLSTEAARRGMPLHPKPLSHENQHKNDRIVWALQGRFEHGKVTLCPGEWTKEFEDQYINFPSKLVHDDAMDALAFIVQLAKDRVFENFGHSADEPYYEVLDDWVGV